VLLGATEFGYCEFVSVAEALAHALGVFDAEFCASSVYLWVPGLDGVSLFRKDDRTVVVVGQGAVAEAVRTGLPVQGWADHCLPERVTFLSSLRERLGTRTFSLLRREGFTSLEEVVAVPDAGLLDIRNLGPSTIAALRMIAAEEQARSVVGPVILSDYQAAELLMLLKDLLVHVKPQRKDELTRAVSEFVVATFPTADG
jgi:hypothetical protein